MGKFCTKCGRPLQEGEVCSCQQQTAFTQPQETPVQQINPAQQQAAFTQPQMNGQPQGAPVQQNIQQMQMEATKAAASEYCKNIFSAILGIIKKPVTVGYHFAETADIKIAMGMIVLQALITTLFAVVVSGKVSSLMSYVSNEKLPYFSIIAVTLLASVALSCIFALLLMLMQMIFKAEADFKKMLSVVAVRSTLIMPVILVAVVLFWINPGLGIGLFYVSCILGFVVVNMLMSQYVGEEKKDLFTYVYAAVILVFMIVCIFAISKLWIFYLPDSVREIMTDPSGAVRSLLQSIM